MHPAPTPQGSAGPYRLAGADASGRELFGYRFGMMEIADGPVEDAASFTFAIPAPEAWAGVLDRITLTGPEGTVEMGREDARPEVLVLDAATRRIRAILGAEPGQAAIAADAPPGLGMTVTLVSRGVPGAAAWRR